MGNCCDGSLYSCCCACVPQASIGVLTQCGRFVKPVEPGCNCFFPCAGYLIKEQVSLKLRELKVRVETKTRDNVFVTIDVSVQYRVKPDDVYSAIYSVQTPAELINSNVHNDVRAYVPTKTLNDLFELRVEMANEIQRQVHEAMETYGWEIVQVQITELDPSKGVKDAMNNVLIANYNLQSAQRNAEAKKVTIIAQAEAEAQSKALQGKGIAAERTAIAQGFKESVDAMAGTGISQSAAAETLIMTLYCDTMRTMSVGGNASTIFVQSDPAGVTNLRQQIRTGMLEANTAQSLIDMPQPPARNNGGN